MERHDDFITVKIIKSLAYKSEKAKKFNRDVEELDAKYRPKQIGKYVENGSVVRVYEAMK